MPNETDRVRVMLGADEPDYSRAAELGSEAVSAVAALSRVNDPLMAAKAVYLASLLPYPEAAEVVQEAASRQLQQVRVAAAAAAANLDEPTGTTILTGLVGDADVGVRKVAVESATHFRSPALTDRVEAVSKSDPVPGLRDLAANALEEMRSAAGP